MNGLPRSRRFLQLNRSSQAQLGGMRVPQCRLSVAILNNRNSLHDAFVIPSAKHMAPIIPQSFLFRYSLAAHRCDELPILKRGKLISLPKEFAIVVPSGLTDGPAFADLRIAWNDQGLAITANVTGKKHPPEADPQIALESDGLQLWIDTRDTQSIHRASRFCHHFCILPRGGGQKKDQACVVQLPIARAREDAPTAVLKTSKVSASLTQDGYELSIWLPAEALTGFEPEVNPRIGFYYCVRDSELGEQCLSVDREFPFDHDPSLWATLRLVSDDTG